MESASWANKISTLCALDLSLIHTALTSIKRCNLGAIAAHRSQHNAGSGYFYGGIYASRLAKELGVSPWPNDPTLPTQYLDFEAMKRHKFLKGTITDYTYNLRFNKEPIVHVVFLRLLSLIITGKEDIMFLRARPARTMRRSRLPDELKTLHQEPP